MRILPSGLFRSFAELPTGSRDKPPQGTAGADGSSRYDGFYGDGAGPDPSPALSGRLRYPVYDEMRHGDATVRASLWMVKLPIRAAQWTLTPASEDAVDQHIADCVAWQFGLPKVIDEPAIWDGRLDQTWDESLQQALLFLDWGAMFEEIIWAKDVETWTDADGDPHPILPIARLAPRFPATINDVRVDPGTGELIAITQDLPDTRPIPGEKLAYYAMEREGSNWWGTSLLRAMYGPWKIKKGLMIGTAIGWDRHASGVPVVRYPKKGGAKAKQQAEEIGRSYRNHERAYVALEGTAIDGWDVEIKNGSGTIADPTDLLRFYDEQIATAAVQMFSRLGVTNQGSRAVGDTLADPYYLSVTAVAKHIATVRGKRVIRRFVDRNFGKDVDTPELVFSKIQGKNIQVLAQALYDLKNAGLDFSDPPTQNAIRDMLEFEHLPDDFEQKQEAGAKARADALAQAAEGSAVQPPDPTQAPPAQPIETPPAQ